MKKTLIHTSIFQLALKPLSRLWARSKGQLILKAEYQVLPYSKKATKFCSFFCPSLQEWLNQTNKISLLRQIAPNYWFKSTSAFIFCFNHFLEARAKNVQNFVDFLEYGRNWYFAFEIYWPLGMYFIPILGQRPPQHESLPRIEIPHIIY